MTAEPETPMFVPATEACARDHRDDAGTQPAEPIERVFEESMNRIALLHQGWLRAVAEFGGGRQADGHDESGHEAVAA
jgi:hypothetical protein